MSFPVTEPVLSSAVYSNILELLFHNATCFIESKLVFPNIEYAFSALFWNMDVGIKFQPTSFDRSNSVGLIVYPVALRDNSSDVSMR